MTERRAPTGSPRADEGDAFAARLAEELPRLVRLATRLLADADVAEDCAQETIVGAWRRRDQLREAAALPAWLRRSLVNRIIDRSRRHHAELDIETVESDWRDDSYTVMPERVLERAELRDELEDGLARLPVIYRLPVVLHDALGWTGAEIASAMDIGLPAAKQRLRRGRMMLVSALAEDDARRQASLAQPMHCWRARRHVSAYLDGELDGATKSTVEHHLESCPTCPPLYASLVGVRATLGGLRDPDTVVEERIAARIRGQLALERRIDLADARPDDTREANRRHWDERHRASDIESSEPNAILIAQASNLPPGTALDVACGDGRNAVWLASRGWHVTGIDWSGVALQKAQASARAAGVQVNWIAADLLRWPSPADAFDLVTIAYLHLPPEERRTVYAATARAVAPGGRLLVVGHDRSNLADGVGGPQDPERLFTAEELGSELTDGDPALQVERAEVLHRLPSPDRGPIDALLVIRRRGAAVA
ncbi:MAG: sigma-70 family RNA polymerase sigma factor [Candidatus Limnocylindrales bacterium]